jgi:hypothetical protein
MNLSLPEKVFLWMVIFLNGSDIDLLLSHLLFLFEICHQHYHMFIFLSDLTSESVALFQSKREEKKRMGLSSTCIVVPHQAPWAGDLKN